MKPILASLLVLFFMVEDSVSQEKFDLTEDEKKGSLFFYWGYNRSFFSTTDLHFTGPDFDFTLYDVKASDRPTEFGVEYFNPTTFTIPQYNYRLGYHITDKLIVSGGMDHLKYVVDQKQHTTISGIITENISKKYAGTYLNDPIVIASDFLQFEHTNGFNLVNLDFSYLQPVFSIDQVHLNLLWNIGFGGIWVVTKTDVKIMGYGSDNNFHVAGFNLAGKTGPRIEYKNRIFLQGEVKGGYASLPSVLIKHSAPEVGDHNLTFLEYYVVAGVNFRIKGSE